MCTQYEVEVDQRTPHTRTADLELGGLDFRPALFTGQEPQRLHSLESCELRRMRDHERSPIDFMI